MTAIACLLLAVLTCLPLTSVTASTPTASPSTADDQFSTPCKAPGEKVQFFDVRLPQTSVPSNLTTYVCHTLNIPTIDRGFHIVGFKPLIHNVEVMHHMILFGCPDSSMDPREKPHECSDADGSCRTFLVQWSRGIQGHICSPPQAGVRFGLGSILSMRLQIHWNNQRRDSDLTDASGFRVFYTTSSRRRFDLGNVQVGQNDLEIPPGQRSHTQSGGCSSECTKEWLDRPIFLTRAHIHMHNLGSGGSLTLIHHNHNHTTTRLRIMHETTYDYSNPAVATFNPPVKVKPGDEIRLTCDFNSMSRHETVSWGLGSDAEMCYAFISYFPHVQDFDQCVQFDDHDVCARNDADAIGECVFPGFLHVFRSGMAREIIQHCDLDPNPDLEGVIDHGPPSDHHDAVGWDYWDFLLHVAPFALPMSSSSRRVCSSPCLAAILEVTRHPCMQGRLGVTARREYLPRSSLWKRVKGLIETNSRLC